MVGEGVTLISFGDKVNTVDKELAKKIFSSVGSVFELDENLMNAGVALTGSSPAYVFMFIEAMADAAIEMGIPGDIALTLAAQAVRGSAQMVIETGISPKDLISAVSSPGGTTIEAVKVLEEEHLHSSIAKAMSACTRRAEELSQS
jgi:pyrroline-5-carboxylate reductase